MEPKHWLSLPLLIPTPKQHGTRAFSLTMVPVCHQQTQKQQTVVTSVPTSTHTVSSLFSPGLCLYYPCCLCWWLPAIYILSYHHYLPYTCTCIHTHTHSVSNSYAFLVLVTSFILPHSKPSRHSTDPKLGLSVPSICIHRLQCLSFLQCIEIDFSVSPNRIGSSEWVWMTCSPL